MTSLEAIGYTVGFGSVVLSTCVFLFGTAVRRKHPLIAPRATARPPDVIFKDSASGDDKQYRGNPYFGWIAWSLSLSYDTLLEGVPGTGTREGGRTGRLLSTTLDGIILLRFNALGRRFSALACFLCIFILMPLYSTSPCYPPLYTDDDYVEVYECGSTNLTVLRDDFGRTTFSFVPALSRDKDPEYYHIYAGIRGRLYMAVLVLWILTIYAMHLLRQEWIDLLAMRRVYYLENEVQRERRAIFKRNQVARKNSSGEDHLLGDRDPWIPHPEQPETVANVELYSVLVGNLPSLPDPPKSDLESQQLPAATTARRENVDWQLSLTTAFFDQCVPNQPGFSSSVAAVTILPGAREVGEAWRQWYTAAAKLRRLRYIRRLIRQKRGEAAAVDEHGHPIDADATPPSSMSSRTVTTGARGSSAMGRSYFRRVLGSVVADEGDNHIYEAISFGQEQMAVYSREFAQAAAPCCPNGCNEERLRTLGLEELLELEEEALDAVRLANRRLQDVRRQVALSYTGEDRSGSSLDFSNLPDALAMEGDLTGKIKDLRFSGSNDESLLNSRRKARWGKVEAMVAESRASANLLKRRLPNGVWSRLRCSEIKRAARKSRWNSCITDSCGDFVKSLHEESTFAVVTFTSRQAAVAARQCLKDGRGVGRWTAPTQMPVPPLADAASCDILLCRNCCRPVTLTISDRQKNIRFFIHILLLAIVFIFWSYPLTAAASLLNPATLKAIAPRLWEWAKTLGIDIYDTISGLLSSLIWTLFFALCPVLFKSIANFGAKASSVAQVEFRAMEYFWWFMVIIAFTGPLLTLWGVIVRESDTSTYSFREDFTRILAIVAGGIPNVVAASWLHWIIFRFTVLLPLNYLLQFPAFFFKFLGMPCFSRVNVGGGPGGPVPYRLFVDSGVVILCAFALGPLSPLITPAALCYFFFCEPLLRRNLIFVYRSKYDDGGSRWTFLFKMIISALLVGQILLGFQMVLKRSIGATVLSWLAVPVTIVFKWHCDYKYGQPYNNSALLPTSLLDGWEDQQSTMDEREEHRQFLVDAHKAAYVPVCIAGADIAEFLTAEPAVVVPRGIQEVVDEEDHGDEQGSIILETTKAQSRFQPGASLRRAAGDLAVLARRQSSARQLPMRLSVDDDDVDNDDSLPRGVASARNLHAIGEGEEESSSSHKEDDEEATTRARGGSRRVSLVPNLIGGELVGNDEDDETKEA